MKYHYTNGFFEQNLHIHKKKKKKDLAFGKAGRHRDKINCATINSVKPQSLSQYLYRTLLRDGNKKVRKGSPE